MIHSSAQQEQWQVWRRHLHQHPECAYEEWDTAAFLRERLLDWGYRLSEPIAETGFVASLRKGSSGRSIAFRADMDALPVDEVNELPWSSRNKGRFHGCGHDGHMAMLLGAAERLAEHAYDGTLRLVFQPAEEGKAGARRMIEQGLFEKFPCDEIYAVHNWPDLPVGMAAVGPGPMMAAADRFDIAFLGRGGHAAMPHKTGDTLLTAAQFTNAVQAVRSRAIDPSQSAVVTVSSIHGGASHNVIPREVTLTGTARSHHPLVRDQIEGGVRRIAKTCAEANGVEAQVAYDRYYPSTRNDPRCAEFAAGALEGIGLQVDRHPVPSMAAEDFAFMLERRPGAYVWLGQADDAGHDAPLHSQAYDFNDSLLPIGISFFCRLAESRLS